MPVKEEEETIPTAKELTRQFDDRLAEYSKDVNKSLSDACAEIHGKILDKATFEYDLTGSAEIRMLEGAHSYLEPRLYKYFNIAYTEEAPFVCTPGVKSFVKVDWDLRKKPSDPTRYESLLSWHTLEPILNNARVRVCNKIVADLAQDVCKSLGNGENGRSRKHIVEQCYPTLWAWGDVPMERDVFSEIKKILPKVDFTVERTNNMYTRWKDHLIFNWAIPMAVVLGENDSTKKTRKRKKE